MKKHNMPHILLGFFLAILLLATINCSTFIRDVESTEVYDTARYSVDMVVKEGLMPLPLSEAAPGTFALKEIVAAGDPIPLKHFQRVIDAKGEDFVKASLDSQPPVISQDTRTVVFSEPTVATDFISLLLAPLIGPYAPLASFVLGAVPLGISRYRNKARADRKEALSDAMVTSVDQIFDGLALLPDRELAYKIEKGMKTILQKAQSAAGVAAEAAEVVARLKTPKKTPLVSKEV